MIISSEYDGHPRQLYPSKCEVCPVVVMVPKHCLATRRTCSRVCLAKLQRTQLRKTCSRCRKEFELKPSRANRSKSGLVFCTRFCKDQAQQIEGSSAIHPPHYQDGHAYYRARALRKYGARCSRCAYDRHPEMLDVHHKDGNRSNARLDNLEVLCVWCHACETRGVPVHSRILGAVVQRQGIAFAPQK